MLVGDQDTITPRAEAEQMAAPIPGTGHMSPLEDAAQWRAAVAEFWR